MGVIPLKNRYLIHVDNTLALTVSPLTTFIVFLIYMLISPAALALTVKDSLGSQELPAPATRVIALNWGATEEMLELGVTPLGVAEIEGYKTWVAQPVIPETVMDVGTRAEPNIERIAGLKPDLIVIGSMQKNMIARLKPIAPVLYFDNYRADHDNFSAIKESFQQLAVALGKADIAMARLDAQNEKLKQLKQRLNVYFNGQLPKVTVVRFSDAHHVRAYGLNSMPLAALKELGIEPAIAIKNSTWGQVQKPIRDLAYMKGVLLYLRPLPKEAELFEQPLFRMMPFVAEGRIAPVRSTWTYGGALSISYLAEHFVEALMTLPATIASNNHALNSHTSAGIK
ncbi:iron-siderophore ABC transporter substrate-binding protein [Oceanospirillum maris]|uniref:ABC transporter substrate-binding protein n=1 Tax=Oceanospirillum maris TaxID=64977 RepID=UPI00041DAD11|nr:iron-siderophore ABC transporter substrate-binding protein [Oceanospirillum maris]